MYAEHALGSSGPSPEERKTVREGLALPQTALEAARRRFPDLLADPQLENLAHRLEMDPDPAAEQELPALATLLRAVRLDAVVTGFLQRHPDGAVVQLGAGLDTTFWRVAPQTEHWYAVDAPAALSLRERLLPTHPRLHGIGGDLEGSDWLAEIDEVVAGSLAGGARPPVLILCAQPLPVRSAQEAGALMRRLAQRFPGAEVAFPAPSRASARWAGADRTRPGGTGDTEPGYVPGHPRTEVPAWEAGARLISDKSVFSEAALPQEVSRGTRARVRLLGAVGAEKILHAQLGPAA